MDTLNNFLVWYKHIVVQTPFSKLALALLQGMCNDAAKCVELQYGREYGFINQDTSKDHHGVTHIGATHIYNIAAEEMEGLETIFQ